MANKRTKQAMTKQQLTRAVADLFNYLVPKVTNPQIQKIRSKGKPDPNTVDYLGYIPLEDFLDQNGAIVLLSLLGCRYHNCGDDDSVPLANVSDMDPLELETEPFDWTCMSDGTRRESALRRWLQFWDAPEEMQDMVFSAFDVYTRKSIGRCVRYIGRLPNVKHVARSLSDLILDRANRIDEDASPLASVCAELIQGCFDLPPEKPVRIIDACNTPLQFGELVSRSFSTAYNIKGVAAPFIQYDELFRLLFPTKYDFEDLPVFSIIPGLHPFINLQCWLRRRIFCRSDLVHPFKGDHSESVVTVAYVPNQKAERERYVKKGDIVLYKYLPWWCEKVYDTSKSSVQHTLLLLSKTKGLGCAVVDRGLLTGLSDLLFSTKSLYAVVHWQDSLSILLFCPPKLEDPEIIYIDAEQFNFEVNEIISCLKSPRSDQRCCQIAKYSENPAKNYALLPPGVAFQQKLLSETTTTLSDLILSQGGDWPDEEQCDPYEERTYGIYTFKKGERIQVIPKAAFADMPLPYMLDVEQCYEVIGNGTQECYEFMAFIPPLKHPAIVTNSTDDWRVLDFKELGLDPTDSKVALGGGGSYLEIDDSRVMPEYLAYWLKEKQTFILDQLEQLRGITNVNVLFNDAIMNLVRIQLPSIDEQRRILDAYREELVQREKNRYEKRVRQLVEEFSEFEMARSLAHNLLNKMQDVTTPLNRLGKYIKRTGIDQDPVKERSLPNQKIQTVSETLEAAKSGLSLMASSIKAVRAVAAMQVKQADFKKIQLLDFLRQKFDGLEHDSYRLEITGQNVSCRAHPDLLMEAIDNLIKNAVAHGHDGKDDWIRFEVTRRNDRVLIQCTNSGRPFPKDFSKEDYLNLARKSKQSKGMGIGGAWVARLLKTHGGRLILQYPEIGANITLELPALPENEET